MCPTICENRIQSDKIIGIHTARRLNTENKTTTKETRARTQLRITFPLIHCAIPSGTNTHRKRERERGAHIHSTPHIRVYGVIAVDVFVSVHNSHLTIEWLNWLELMIEKVTIVVAVHDYTLAYSIAWRVKCINRGVSHAATNTLYCNNHSVCTYFALIKFQWNALKFHQLNYCSNNSIRSENVCPIDTPCIWLVKFSIKNHTVRILVFFSSFFILFHFVIVLLAQLLLFGPTFSSFAIKQ